MRAMPLLALVAALVAANAVGAVPVDEDVLVVNVAGKSATQLNATRYDVQQSAQDVQAPEVNIDGLGRVVGTVSYTEQSRRPIYQYFGLPFGESPVGELRFVAPKPKTPWKGVWNATSPGKICIQTDTSAVLKRRRRDLYSTENKEQSEDCLILDVHTPKVDRSAKLPVLVFVHGGSFHTGYAGLKTPQGLLEDDVILVSPQYRLGVLGFLNLQTDAVPGNAGLLDVVEALQWVNKYISHFGGDPNRVTLGGHSAGAAMASLLYLSPLTKGLIHGVLPMSGCALADWSYDRNPEAASNKVSAGARCGGAETPIAQRVDCLRKAPASTLVQSFLLLALQSVLGGSLGMSSTLPSVQHAGAVKVLPDWPENIISSKSFVPLPYLTGVTKHEGTFPLELAETGYLTPTRLKTNDSFIRNDLIHVLLKVISLDDPAGFVADSSIQAFMDTGTLGDYNAMKDGLVDLLGSFAFKSPARRIVQRNSDLGQPSYLYAFNYNGAVTQAMPEGVYHGADQVYLFPDGSVKLLGDDFRVAHTLRKLIANFVMYQDPSPQSSPVTEASFTASWPKFQRDSERYLEVVWPTAEMQWFRTEYTVARREQFFEGEKGATAAGTTSATKATSATSAASAAPVTPKSRGTTRMSDQDESAASSLQLPTHVVILALVASLAARWSQ